MIGMQGVFDRTCPWGKCNKPIVRAVGNLDSDEVEVRCDSDRADHRSIAKRDSMGRITIKPKK